MTFNKDGFPTARERQERAEMTPCMEVTLSGQGPKVLEGVEG